MSSPRKGSTGFLTPAPSGEDLRTASVRVRRRRATTVSRPSALQDAPASAITTPSQAQPEQSASSSAAPAPPASAPATPAKKSTPSLGVPASASPPIGTIGRRRALTISQRLRTEDAATAEVVEQTAAEEVGRQRSNTIASTGSRTRRQRAGSPTAADVANAQFNVVETHDQDEVDLLEVLDQRVSTTAALTNITSAFWPSFLTQPPIVELEPVTPDTPEREGSFIQQPAEEGAAVTPSGTLTPMDELDWDALDDDDDLAPHLKKLLKKRKRSQKLRAAGLGMWTFLKTPLGVAALIYGLLVVVWGAGLVLLLIVPMGSYARKLWVEIASQVLTGLFCVTSLLPLPWRLMDAYQISIIYSYARRTRERRAKLGLAPLRDPNDLPEPENAEYWVGPGGERLTGPRQAPTVAPPKKDKAKAGSKDPTPAVTPAAQNTREIELGTIESKVGVSPPSTAEEVEEVPVLSEAEEERLRRAQLKFGRSQTWYRAHSSPTHHAFPIGQALLISLFTLLNSVWQCFLCGCMWGLNRFNRPAWTTGCLIPLSFGCGIAAAVLIWRCGEMTKKKAEVSRKVWHMLQRDEKELDDRRKAAAEARKAAKEEKKAHKRLSSQAPTMGTITPSSSGAMTPSGSLHPLTPSFNLIRPSIDETRPSFDDSA